MVGHLIWYLSQLLGHSIREPKGGYSCELAHTTNKVTG